MTGAFNQLAIIWIGVLLAILAARATRLTPPLFYLAAGSIMANTGILPDHLDPFIQGLSELGILLIMFALGFEENSSAFVRSIRKSWGIAFFGALAPFCTAYAVADFFFDDFHVSLLVGLAMTATAVSLTMVSLRSENLHTHPAATRIMTSAVLDDVASLALVALMIPIVTGQGDTTVTGLALILGKVFLFFGLVVIAEIWIFPLAPKGLIGRLPLIRQFGVRDIISFDEGKHATLVVLLLALAVGILAHHLGFHPAIGAYMAGLLMRREYFLVDEERDAHKQTHAIIDNAAFSWIGPVFFVQLGTELIFDPAIVSAVLVPSLVMVVGLAIAQVTSAGLAARYTGGMDWPSSLLVGFGMLGRAELAFVVINLGYVEHRILSTEAFYMLMFAAFCLNVLVPVSIAFWKAKVLPRSAYATTTDPSAGMLEAER